MQNVSRFQIFRILEKKSIKGYDGYSISRCGRVFTDDRLILGANNSERLIKGIEKKIQRNQHGVPVVQLSCDGKKNSYSLALLLAETFLDYDKSTQKICFRDGDNTNVSIDNIVIVPNNATIKVIPEHYDFLKDNGLVE